MKKILIITLLLVIGANNVYAQIKENNAEWKTYGVFCSPIPRDNSYIIFQNCNFDCVGLILVVAFNDMYKEVFAELLWDTVVIKLPTGNYSIYFYYFQDGQLVIHEGDKIKF